MKRRLNGLKFVLERRACTENQLFFKPGLHNLRTKFLGDRFFV